MFLYCVFQAVDYVSVTTDYNQMLSAEESDGMCEWSVMFVISLYQTSPIINIFYL